MKLDPSLGKNPNAYQAIGPDGRPVIALNVAMIESLLSDDEIAFVIGHEAGHHVANHLLKAKLAQVGGGELGTAFDQYTAELEADKLGALVAQGAGYDPVIGSRSLNRLPARSKNSPSHPPVASRLATVEKAAGGLS